MSSLYSYSWKLSDSDKFSSFFNNYWCQNWKYAFAKDISGIFDLSGLCVGEFNFNSNLSAE